MDYNMSVIEGGHGVCYQKRVSNRHQVGFGTYLVAGALQAQRRLVLQGARLVHQLDFALRYLYIIGWRHNIVHIVLVILIAIFLVLPA